MMCSGTETANSFVWAKSPPRVIGSTMGTPVSRLNLLGETIRDLSGALLFVACRLIQ